MRGTLFALGLALAGCGSYEGPSGVDAKGGSAGSAGADTQAGSTTAAGSAGTPGAGGSSSTGGTGGSPTAGAESEGGSSGQVAGGNAGKPSGGAPPVGGAGGSSVQAGAAGTAGGGTGGQAPKACDCYELHLNNRAYCVASSEPKGFTCVQCAPQNADCDGDTIEPDIGSGCEVAGSSHCPL